MASKSKKTPKQTTKRREAELRPGEMAQLHALADHFNEIGQKERELREEHVDMDPEQRRQAVRNISMNPWFDARNLVRIALYGPDGMGRAVNKVNEISRESFASYADIYFNRAGRMVLYHYSTLRDGRGQSVPFLYLFNSFFQSDNHLRLKQCRRCEQWFVDETRNHKKINCSDRCRNLFWTRKRRGTKKI